MNRKEHYLKPEWPAPRNVHAYTTTRLITGHSQPPYANFNLGLSVGDDPVAVEANRQQLVQDLELPAPPIWLHQVHGIDVYCADEPPSKDRPAADAVYSQKPGSVCLISTADCLPVLLCDRDGSTVAAIHAGWRGLAAGVIEATIVKLKLPGHSLMAWLGPAIGPTAFEVGEEVYQQFLAHDIHAKRAFQPTRPGHWLADLYQLAKQRLAEHSVNAVYGGNLCTYRDPKHFYSHRRDRGLTGRMASLIWLK